MLWRLRVGRGMECRLELVVLDSECAELRRLSLGLRKGLSGFRDGCVVVEMVIVLLKGASMAFRELQMWHLLGLARDLVEVRRMYQDSMLILTLP